MYWKLRIQIIFRYIRLRVLSTSFSSNTLSFQQCQIDRMPGHRRWHGRLTTCPLKARSKNCDKEWVRQVRILAFRGRNSRIRVQILIFRSGVSTWTTASTSWQTHSYGVCLDAALGARTHDFGPWQSRAEHGHRLV